MSNQITGYATLINNKMKFSGISRDNDEIIIDYSKPIGDGEGYTPLELFLVSFAACSGSTVSQLLRMMNKDVSGLKISAYGDRREEHPTYFKKILIHFELKSKDAEASDMEKAIKLSEEKFCPVWNMVKNNVEISFDYEIIKVD